jgi:NAD(P)-dependent dehydrogenase (short-subunit alcohol dehydrogenase family)
MEEMSVKLTDRVAIVTGAAQGIGAVYAKFLAYAGCRTIIGDVNDSLGRKVSSI